MSVVSAGPDAAVLTHQDHLLELIASGTAPEAILTDLAARLETLFDGGRCSVLLLSDDGCELRHGAAPNLPPSYCEAIDGLVIGPQAGSCGTAAFLGELVVARDTSSDERWAAYRDLAREHGLRACWSSPIKAPDGTVLGTFAVYHNEPHEPTPTDVGLLQRFSGLAAVAIRHAAMLAEVRAAEAARAAAEERSLAKGHLLSAMSHELRTPMSSIVGYAEMLRTVSLPPERRERAVAHLIDAAQHLLGLVEDLLDLAKLDAGIAEISVEPVDVRTVIAEAVVVLGPSAADGEVTIVNPSSPHPLLVLADARWLRQTLINVIGNAVKYNDRGGTVEIELTGDERRAEISVHDTGPGLPQARDGLFEPFDRLGAEASAVPGTGLGLTISKQFVETMGGRLEISDRPGGGTTVTIELAAGSGAHDRPRCETML